MAKATSSVPNKKEKSKVIVKQKTRKVTSIGNSSNTRYNKKGTKKKNVGQGR